MRIYLALLLALGLTAALFATAWQLSPEKARTGANLDTFAEIASEALPPASASLADQQAGLARWRPRADLTPGSYTHLRAHETKAKLVCRLLLEKKKQLHLDSRPAFLLHPRYSQLTRTTSYGV